MINGIKLNIIFLIIISTTLFSCYKETREVTIEVFSAKNLAENENSGLPNIIKSLLEPIDLDSIGYIPSISITRIDLDKENNQLLVIPTNEIGDFQKSMGTYSFSDYLSDFNDADFTAGKLLSAPSSSMDVSAPEADFIFFLDSSKISAPNEFGSIASLKVALISKLTSNPDLKKITIAIGQPKIGSAQEGDLLKLGLKKFIGQGDWDKASVVANQLAVLNFNTASFCDSLIREGDENFIRVKQLQDVGMIDVPMGYYAIAYELADAGKKGFIKNKYEECLDYLRQNGGQTITLPTLPSN